MYTRNCSNSFACLLFCGLYAFAPISLQAAEWRVTQQSNVQGALTVKQSETNDSEQGLNLIILRTSDGLVSATQNAVFAAGINFSMEQTGGGNGNVQAINHAEANVLNDISQNVSGFDHAQLLQTTTAGGNIQALNYARTTTTATDITQTVTGTEATLNNQGASANNVQTINYLQIDGNGTTADVDQTVTLGTLNIDYSNSSGLSGGITRYQNLNYGQGINMILAQDPDKVSATLTSNIEVLNINGAAANYDGTVQTVLNRIVQK